AARGLGAWLGDRRISTSAVDQLGQSLLATGFPPDMHGKDKLLEWWQYFGLRAHGLRRTGSTALNLAYLAAGRFDGYWAFDNHVWDVAAAVVLVREAGGVMTNADGSPYDPYTPTPWPATGRCSLPCLPVSGNLRRYERYSGE